MTELSKLAQFLPSLARGVYRFNQQLSNYLQEDDAKGFIETKQAFLPHIYREAIERLVALPNNGQALLQQNFPAPTHQGTATRIANQFFEKYLYLKTENNSNYLERKFISVLLARLFNINDLLELVKPQHPVGNYRLDFAIFGEKQYAIELDGFGKFQQRADLDNFVRLQNDIIDK
jgi:hypothetical protein